MAVLSVPAWSKGHKLQSQMIHNRKTSWRGVLWILPLFLSICAGLQAQSTSSTLSGMVQDKSGTPIAGALVKLVHEPTESTQEMTVGTDGYFRFSGLRPGGPYTLSAEVAGYVNWQLSNLQLFLQRESFETVTLTAIGEEDLIQLETMAITASANDYKFDPTNMGANSTFSITDISAMPTVSRSLTDLVRMDPRIAVFDRENGALSAGGKSTKYNSLRIDGIVTKDTFGLQENGAPALKQPFSLETIEQVSVQTSPYDVSQAGFTGASVDAITKSGTNKFKGSIYAFYRDDSMIGELRDTDGALVSLPQFTEYTAGFTLGGPILKNKLFFFANYETSEETRIARIGSFYPYEEDLKNLYKYFFDPGKLTDPGDQKLVDNKYLLKLDWNITKDHRLSLRYNLTEGRQPFFSGYGGFSSTSLNSSWYTDVLDNVNYSIDFYNNWTDDFYTEIKLAYNSFENTKSTNSDLPYFEIGNFRNKLYRLNDTNPEKGRIVFGVPPDIQANELGVETKQLYVKAAYRLTNHTIIAGMQLEDVTNYNLYIPNNKGYWRFDSISDYYNENRAENPAPHEGTYFYAGPSPGTNGAASWALYHVSFYLQDEWKIGNQLTITPGLRIDIPFVSESPVEARGTKDGRSFEQVFGDKNTHTVDGNYVIQPRIGFNYAIDQERKTQIRGGGGLFYGSAPHVWLSSTYVNNGKSIIQFVKPDNQKTDLRHSPYGKVVVPNLDSVTDFVNVDYLDKDFKMPTDWKANIAIDQKLPWLDMQLTLEAQWSWVQHDVHFVNKNLNLYKTFSATGLLPDGRERYGVFPRKPPLPYTYKEPDYGDVLLLTNTDKGKTENYTVQIQRPMKDNYSFNFGYTYQDAKSVNDGLRSSAKSNWASNVAPNPNDEILGTSRYETRHRFTVGGSYRFDFKKFGKTTLSLFYDGRSGRPYSFLADASDGIGDLNNDRIDGNDLLYVPTGIDDPIIAWGSTRRDNLEMAKKFMEYVESTDGLRQYKGKIVPRNTGRSPFIHQFDVKFSHNLKVWLQHELEFSVSILNIGNLINDEWGKEVRTRSSGDVKVVKVDHYPGKTPSGKGNENGAYIYNYDPSLLKYDRQFTHVTGNLSSSSRWSILLGMTYRF